MAETATCHCQNCNSTIEFDTALLRRQGDAPDNPLSHTMTCPHCGLETVVFKPQHQSEPPEKQSPPPSREAGQQVAAIIAIVGVIALLILVAVFEVDRRTAPHTSKGSTNEPPKAEVSGAFGFKLGDRLPDHYPTKRDSSFQLMWDFPDNYGRGEEAGIEPKWILVNKDRIIYEIDGGKSYLADDETLHHVVEFLTEKYGAPDGKVTRTEVSATFGGAWSGTNRFVWVNGKSDSFFISYRDPVLARQADLEAKAAKNNAVRKSLDGSGL